MIAETLVSCWDGGDRWWTWRSSRRLSLELEQAWLPWRGSRTQAGARSLRLSLCLSLPLSLCLSVSPSLSLSLSQSHMKD